VSLTVCVVHNDAELASLGFVNLFEADDVGVVQDLQDLGFSEGFSLLILAHLGNINLLDDSIGLITKISSLG
jgi:hypothetical protein